MNFSETFFWKNTRKSHHINTVTSNKNALNHHQTILQNQECKFLVDWSNRLSSSID
jgi:hypothetical protein